MSGARMRGRCLWLAVAPLALGVVLFAPGCERVPLSSGLLDDPYVASCSLCHGSEENDAPPAALSGAVDTDLLAVGAHQSHLRGGLVRAAIGCDECHIVPQEVADPGHLDPAPADLSFGALATAEDAAPIWDREQATCRNTYCHGATLSGGKHAEPVWNLVDGSQSSCKSCHGAPPPPPHPSWSNCWYCHPETVNEDGSIDIAGGAHMDGELTALDQCWDCHGTEASAGAPPAAIDGAEETTELGVGAHASHLTDNTIRHAIECSECHRVPAEVGSSGHLGTDLPAEIVFGALARARGAEPTWSGDQPGPACSNVYCHGATLEGGTDRDPVWTLVDQSQVACDSCHGAPPPSPHPQDAACEKCHPSTAIDGQTVDISTQTHIDGRVTFR